MRFKLNLNLVVLFMIVLGAAWLYFYKINEVPNSLSDDEATVGYNAFSILSTGKDEFGKTFPLAFRFFGAYTPPLFVYFAVPFVKFFGLTAGSLRALSGISTLAGILIVYRFVRKLNIFSSPLTAILAAFIFAISPWVIFYARIGYEVTSGYVLYSLGALFLWESIAKCKLSLPGLILLSLSTYVAHTERYLVPIFLFFVFTFFRKEIISPQNRNRLRASLIILLLTQIPNFYLLTTRAFWVKNTTFANPSLTVMINDFMAQLLTYFSPKAIFGASPDINLQHTAPELPLLYSWLLIPFLVGSYQLYRKVRTPGGKFLLLFLLTAVIPGALSGHFISVQRVLPMIMPLILIITLGLDWLFSKMKPLFFFPLLVMLASLSLLLFWRSYFVLMPKERGAYWSYGIEELSQIVKSNPDQYYVIDTARAPTIYAGMLFYLKYSPALYQRQFTPDFVANYYNNPTREGIFKFANVELRPIDWKTDVYRDRVLVGDQLTISTDQAAEHFLTRVFEIKDPNGKVILIGYQTNPVKKGAVSKAN